MRTEFGRPRSECACDACREFCRRMPGFLIPADLSRLTDNLQEPVAAYIVRTLRASPGAIVTKTFGQPFRIPTLVPARKPDGTCIHFDAATERCAIWADAPYGCAFFSHDQDREAGDAAASDGLRAVLQAWLRRHSLYSQVWSYLSARGLVSPGPEMLRQKGGSRDALGRVESN